MIHIAAVTQIRLDTEGRAYYRRKRAAGKKRMEAMRCLKQRISDAVYRQLVSDAQRLAGTGPGGHCGATQQSSAVDLPPHIDTSDQPLPRTRDATGHHDPCEPPSGSGSPANAPTRRSRQGAAPHRTNDLDGDKRRRILQRAESGVLTTEGSRKDAREEPRQSQASVAALTAPDPVVPWQARLSLLGAASLKSGVVEARTKARRRARRQLLGEVLASQWVSAGRGTRPGFGPLGRFRGAVFWPGARWGARGRRAGAARSAGPPSPDPAWRRRSRRSWLDVVTQLGEAQRPPADGRKPRVRVRKRPVTVPAHGAE